MNGHTPHTDGPPPPPRRQQVYDALLHEAESVSEKALARLRRLCERFPSAVPDPELEQLQRARSDPGSERRRMLRLSGGLATLTVRTARSPGPKTEARVVDRSAGGLGLKLPEPVEPGAVVEVHLPADETESDWFAAQVRYCRRNGDGWVVGCEFLDQRPAG